MSEKPLPFVITDRRKFNAEGEPRPDADPSPAKVREAVPEAPPAPTPIAEVPRPIAVMPGAMENEELLADSQLEPADAAAAAEDMPPAPTAEQMEQSRAAYEATAERLETAIRSANPGMEHAPPMSFEQIVQSVYMQAILQLGGGTQEGQQPQVDLLGARQSIDMLGILLDKSAGNLSATEEALAASAVFELRLAFLEITQALARSAQQRSTGPGAGPGNAGPGNAGPGGFGGRPGPSIVR